MPNHDFTQPMQLKELPCDHTKNLQSRRAKSSISHCCAAALCSVSFSSASRNHQARKSRSSAANVFKELAADKENGLPINLLNKSVCVIILPSVKKGRVHRWSPIWPGSAHELP